LGENRLSSIAFKQIGVGDDRVVLDWFRDRSSPPRCVRPDPTSAWDETTTRSKADPIAGMLYTNAASDRAIVKAVAEVAKARGVSRAQVALAWLRRNPVLVAPHIGASKNSHIDDDVASLTIDLTDEDVSRLEAPTRRATTSRASPTPPNSPASPPGSGSSPPRIIRRRPCFITLRYRLPTVFAGIVYGAKGCAAIEAGDQVRSRRVPWRNGALDRLKRKPSLSHARECVFLQLHF
jgi:Aldo/keto reductase family